MFEQIIEITLQLSGLGRGRLSIVKGFPATGATTTTTSLAGTLGCRGTTDSGRIRRVVAAAIAPGR